MSQVRKYVTGGKTPTKKTFTYAGLVYDLEEFKNQVTRNVDAYAKSKNFSPKELRLYREGLAEIEKELDSDNLTRSLDGSWGNSAGISSSGNRDTNIFGGTKNTSNNAIGLATGVLDYTLEHYVTPKIEETLGILETKDKPEVSSTELKLGGSKLSLESDKSNIATIIDSKVNNPILTKNTVAKSVAKNLETDKGKELESINIPNIKEIVSDLIKSSTGGLGNNNLSLRPTDLEIIDSLTELAKELDKPIKSQSSKNQLLPTLDYRKLNKLQTSSQKDNTRSLNLGLLTLLKLQDLKAIKRGEGTSVIPTISKPSNQSSTTSQSSLEDETPYKDIIDRLTTKDKIRIGTALGDLTSVVSSFVPGYGSLVSLGTGVASTLTNAGLDLSDGIDGSDFTNLVAGLGTDLLGVVPVAGIPAKLAKIGKVIRPALSVLVGAASAANLPKGVQALIKLSKNPEEMSSEDILDALKGLSSLMGITKVSHVAAKLASASHKIGNKSDEVFTVKTSDAKIPLTKAQYEVLKTKGGKKELINYLEQLTGRDDLGTLSGHYSSKNWAPFSQRKTAAKHKEPIYTEEVKPTIKSRILSAIGGSNPRTLTPQEEILATVKNRGINPVAELNLRSLRKLFPEHDNLSNKEFMDKIRVDIEDPKVVKRVDELISTYLKKGIVHPRFVDAPTDAITRPVTLKTKSNEKSSSIKSEEIIPKPTKPSTELTSKSTSMETKPTNKPTLTPINNRSRHKSKPKQSKNKRRFDFGGIITNTSLKPNYNRRNFISSPEVKTYLESLSPNNYLTFNTYEDNLDKLFTELYNNDISKYATPGIIPAKISDDPRVLSQQLEWSRRIGTLNSPIFLGFKGVGNSGDNLKGSGDQYYGLQQHLRTLGRDITDEESKYINTILNKKGLKYTKNSTGGYRVVPLIENAKGTVLTPIMLNEILATPITNLVSGLQSLDGATSLETRPSLVDSKRFGNRTIEPRTKTPLPSIKPESVISAARMLGTVLTNNKATKLIARAMSPLLLDTFENYIPQQENYIAKTSAQQLAAELQSLGNRIARGTSDASLGAASQLEANKRAREAIFQGDIANELRLYETGLLSRQESAAAKARRVDVANRNQAAIKAMELAKSLLKASNKIANWQTAVQPYLADIEYGYRKDRDQQLQYNMAASSSILEAEFKDRLRELQITDPNYREKREALVLEFNLKALKNRLNSSKYNWILEPKPAFASGGKISFELKLYMLQLRDFNKALLANDKAFLKAISENNKLSLLILKNISGFTADLVKAGMIYDTKRK